MPSFSPEGFSALLISAAPKSVIVKLKAPVIPMINKSVCLKVRGCVDWLLDADSSSSLSRGWTEGDWLIRSPLHRWVAFC